MNIQNHDFIRSFKLFILFQAALCSKFSSSSLTILSLQGVYASASLSLFHHSLWGKQASISSSTEEMTTWQRTDCGLPITMRIWQQVLQPKLSLEMAAVSSARLRQPHERSWAKTTQVTPRLLTNRNVNNTYLLF